MFESEPLKTHNVRQLVEMSTYGGQEDVLNTHVMRRWRVTVHLPVRMWSG